MNDVCRFYRASIPLNHLDVFFFCFLCVFCFSFLCCFLKRESSNKLKKWTAENDKYSSVDFFSNVRHDVHKIHAICNAITGGDKRSTCYTAPLPLKTFSDEYCVVETVWKPWIDLLYVCVLAGLCICSQRFGGSRLDASQSDGPQQKTHYLKSFITKATSLEIFRELKFVVYLSRRDNDDMIRMLAFQNISRPRKGGLYWK